MIGLFLGNWQNTVSLFSFADTGTQMEGEAWEWKTLSLQRFDHIYLTTSALSCFSASCDDQILNSCPLLLPIFQKRPWTCHSSVIAYLGGSWDKLLLLAFFINQVKLSDFLFFSVFPKGRMPGETHQVLVLLVNWKNISIPVRKKQKPVAKKQSHQFGFHDLLIGWVLRLW